MLLLMLLNGEGKGVRFEVSGRTPVFIGRHALGLDKPDSRMSRQHAEVWLEDGVWLLRDLNATNGTFINGHRVEGLCELEVGDHLRCGRTEFVVADIRANELENTKTPDTDDHDLDSTAVLPGSAGVALMDDIAVPTTSEDEEELDLAPASSQHLHGEDLDLDLDLALESDEPADAQEAQPAASHQDDEASALKESDADLVSLEDDPKFKVKRQQTTPKPAANENDESLDLVADLDDAPESAPESTPETKPETTASAHDGSHDYDSAATLAPDEYAADAGLVGLSLGHQPPPAPAETPTPTEEVEAEAEIEIGATADQIDEPQEIAVDHDSRVGDVAESADLSAELVDDKTDDALSADEIEAIQGLTSDVSEDEDAMAPEQPAQPESAAIASDSDDQAQTPDNAMVEASDADADAPTQTTDDDDDVLKLGFQGAEPPTHHIDVDEPGLRGQPPAASSGRFVVTETDDDLYGPTDADTPDATAERAALLGTDHPGDQAADPWAEPSRSRGPMGKGKQRLPLAAVGVIVVAAVTAALFYTANQMGWLEKLGPSTVAGRDDTNGPADIATDSNTLASATTPNLDRVPGNNDNRSVFMDPRSLRRNQPTQTSQPAADTDTTPAVVTQPETSAATPSATSQGATLPELPTQAPQPTAPAPRVANAEQLKALIDNATPDHSLGSTKDARLPGNNRNTGTTTAAVTPTKTQPEAQPQETQPTEAVETTPEPESQAVVADASQDFAWSGVSIGDADSVFTKPRNGSTTQAADQTQNTTTAQPRLNPEAGTGVIRTNPVNRDTDRNQTTAVAPAASPANSAPAAVPAGQRQVAFLVDVSGTMVDSMPQLRDHLATAIEQLAPEETFTVLLFRQNQTLEMSPVGLHPATASAKSAALRWLAADAQNIQLGGRSDPLPALRAALNHGVNEVVLLSDNALGRRVKPGGKDLELADLTDTLAASPGVKLHAIQFFYDDDRELLKNLAIEFDGNFEFVQPVTDANPDAPDILGRTTPRP